MWHCVNNIFGYCKTQPDGADKAKPVFKETTIEGTKQTIQIGTTSATCSRSSSNCENYQATEKKFTEETAQASVITAEKNNVKKEVVNESTKVSAREPDEMTRRDAKPKELNLRMFDENYDSSSKEWKDMPEFISEDLNPWKSILVHFESKENMQSFARLLNQKITQATKYIWFPEMTNERLTNKRYVDES